MIEAKGSTEDIGLQMMSLLTSYGLDVVVAVVELADSAVNLSVRVWSDAGDNWSLKVDLIKAIKERLDAEGISMPYPQRTVHLSQAGV